MDDRHELEKTALQRRRFLLTLGTAGASAAVAVAAVTGKGAPQAGATAAAASAPAPEAGVSEHARAYYRSARI